MAAGLSGTGLHIDIESFGTERFGQALRDMVERASHPEPVLDAIADDFFRLVGGAFGGNPDLIRTRELLRSFAEQGHEGHVRKITRTGAAVGTEIWYARFHKEELLDELSPTDAARWVEMLEDYIGGRAGGTFGFTGVSGGALLGSFMSGTGGGL